jgi:hypothetical protein
MPPKKYLSSVESCEILPFNRPYSSDAGWVWRARSAGASRVRLIGLNMKNCPTCRRCLPFSDFNRSRSRKDGFHAVCRECQKSHEAKYMSTERGQATRKRGERVKHRRRMASEPTRRKLIVRSMVRTAVRRGKLRRGVCFCGNPKTEAHHEDYARPFDVIWLCRQHHAELHRNKSTKN